MKQQTVLIALTIALGCGPHDGGVAVSPVGPAIAAKVPAPPASIPVPAPSALRPEIGTWGFDVAGMDRTVRPGAAFYQYASGRWLASTVIPEQRSTYTTYTVLTDRAAQRARQIIETASGPPGSDGQRIGDYYRTYMDEAAIETAELAPLRPELDRIAAIRDRRGVVLAFAASSRRLDTAPFRVWIDLDSHTPDHYLPVLFQGGLGLSDRDMYSASAAQFAPVRDAYLTYIAAMFRLIGWTDAERRAAAVYALEDRIARAHWTAVENRDPQKTYNPMTRAELEKLAPGIDWKAWLAAVGLAGQATINVMQPSEIAAIDRLLAREPIAVWRDYLTLQLLTASSEYLPRRFGDAHFAMFDKALSGRQQREDRSRRAIDDVTDKLGLAVARIYVAKYFTPETKAAAEALVNQLRRALELRIDGLGWMSAQTKVQAKAKLAAVGVEIGYPKNWRDYSSLSIIAGDAIGNAQRAQEFEYHRLLDLLGRTGPSDDWPNWLTPMTVDAVSNVRALLFAAGQLQPPFFDPAADAAINYGGIGGIIGHELGHLLDDRGAQYDATGALRNWWTPEDSAKFKAATAKLVAQYNAYCPIPARDGRPAQCVNGAFTLSENVADLVGVTVAYDAYEASLGGRPAPVIDGLTGEQRFFLGWAQIWRARLREQRLASNLVQDFHSPMEYRVDTIRNLDAWYDAFHPSPSDALYLPPDQRVRIW